MSFPAVETTAYDEVRYSNHPYAQTHPERLAIVARLHGIETPDPSHARVLEFACGAGANLLGMAYAYPDLRAVGVDLASSAIAEAQERAEGAGLDNVEFIHGDVTQLRDGQLGEFDFVISHGLYAWVPEEVQDGLLAAVKSHLAPDGVAYISYNAMPGGHIRTMIREMGMFHAREVAGDMAKAEAARGFYEWLQLRANGDDAFAMLLQWELPSLVRGPISRIVHDDFSPNWSPVYFADFMEHAGRHGLAYVGEAQPTDLVEGRWPEGVEEQLEEIAGDDRIAREQYGDFLLCRRFRQTVLCHEGRESMAMPDAAAMMGMGHTTNLEADAIEEEDLRPVIALLAETAPDPVPFPRIAERLGTDEQTAAELLLRTFMKSYTGPHVAPPPRAGAPGERPRASALARHQIERGDKEVTTLTHGVVAIEEPEARALIALLDGTRTQAELIDALAADGLEVTPEEMEVGLRGLGRMGLLHE